MSKINITSRMRCFNPDMEECYYRRYDENGVLHEDRVLASECDYHCEALHRSSTDNGRTWTEWVMEHKDADSGRRGTVEGSEEGDQILGGFSAPITDPKTGCKVSTGSFSYYIKGHHVGYFAMAEEGKDYVRTHGYFRFTRPDGTEVTRMLEFEEGGADYDPAKYRDPAYLDKNRCSAGDLRILPDGDLMFMVCPTMTICCKLAGIDVNSFFPSCPNLQVGLLVARAHWNEEKEDYDITYSNPIMLCDLQSSRGIMEPQLIFLPDGRWMMVIRGSNYVHDGWNTRISTAAPGYKWVTYSYDEGKTFTPLMPWHFDTREVVYSSASTSSFYRSPQNGRLYWIGNIVEPSMIHANDPRFPLQICEVNEELGCLIKDTLTIIDTVREGQYKVELSNANIVTNPETKNLEVRLTKININDAEQGMGHPGDWYSEAWEYIINFE